MNERLHSRNFKRGAASNHVSGAEWKVLLLYVKPDFCDLRSPPRFAPPEFWPAAPRFPLRSHALPVKERSQVQ